MSRYQTAEQVEDEYLRLMGPDLGQLHYELYQELAWLHIKWQQFRDLFGKDPARIELLNSIAPLFFYYLQQTLYDDVLLHLARLTDPPRSFGRENLTVRRLPELIAHPALSDEVATLLDQLSEKCDFARQLRNRRLAHADLLTARRQNAVPLPPESRQSVEEALDAFRTLLNRLEVHFCESELGYAIGAETEPGGAEEMVYYLEPSLKTCEEQMERWTRSAGDSSPPS